MPAHVPVLLDEIVHWLAPAAGQTLVDGTLGGAGHTRALAERVGPSGMIVSLDRDPAALAMAERSLKGLPVKLVQANFRELREVLQQLEMPPVGGVVLDLGMSSDQLLDPERGFSFDSEGSLDMRFDPDEGEPAWRLLERMSEKQLADLIYQFGEERFSRRIARKIVEQRRKRPIRTARELAELVRSCVPRGRGGERIDPATRTFQALRIAANEELTSLDLALDEMPECIHAGGRLAIISFHSLEDRRVKEKFRDDPRYAALTKKPIRASEREVAENPRARSAKLRVAQINPAQK